MSDSAEGRCRVSSCPLLKCTSLVIAELTLSGAIPSVPGVAVTFAITAYLLGSDETEHATKGPLLVAAIIAIGARDSVARRSTRKRPH